MINKKIFVFDIEFAGTGKNKIKIKPNEQLLKIAKIMYPGQNIIKMKELFSDIIRTEKDLVSKKIQQSYLNKLKTRIKASRNISGIDNVELHFTDSPHFKYANHPVYYIDFAYAVLSFDVDENNKINNPKQSEITHSDNNIDFIKNIAKMCTEIGNSQNNIIASFNVDVDYSRIMIALSCSRFFSENDSSGDGAYTSIEKLLQLREQKKILDVRKIFIKLFSVRKENKDEIGMKYVKWCIANGYVTRALNIKTQMEQFQIHYRRLYNDEFKQTSLIDPNGYKQKHNAKDDVADLMELMAAKMKKELDWSIYFETLKEDNFKTDFVSTNLKTILGQNNYKKELADNGYIIYGMEKRNFSDLDDSDIDKIIEIPFNTKIKGYIDSTNTVLDLIEKINLKTFNNNNERMSYLKQHLKVLKGNQKKVDEKDAFKRIIEGKVTEGIKDVTVTKLLENEILKYTKNQSLGSNIIHRIRFLLYYFLEQQKLIEFVNFLGEFYHAYIRIIKTEKELEIFNNAVQSGYTGLIEFIKQKQKDDGLRMLADALGDLDNDGGEFTYLTEAQVDFKKSRTKKTRSMDSLIKASTSIPDLSTAIKRAVAIALLEDKASNSLKKSNGGAYYEDRIGDNASSIGSDVMLYAKTSTTKSSNIANTLAIYYSFVPGNTYLYVAFSRLYGSKKYKSYIYHGVQYDYYLKMLEEIVESGTLGSAAWRIRRMNFTGRSLIQSSISKRTKFYQAISGEDKTKNGNTASPHAIGVISSFEQHRKNRGKAGKISKISLKESMFDADKLHADAMLVTSFYHEAISLFTGSGKN